MKSQCEMQNDGNMFMDTPHHENFDDLITLVNDKVFWKSQESNIPSHLRGLTMYTDIQTYTQLIYLFYLFISV